MSKPRYLLVERDEAQDLLLLSLVSFGVTVILVRLFLQLTGYPQIGSSTLHIAHLLWGGLFLFAAVLLVLIWDNPSAYRSAAVLSGIGIGLFIDEVGKFITRTNDYFFPPAAPIIYGFFLLTVVLYLYVRQPDEHDPRRAIVHALEKLQDAIYGELEESDLKELAADLNLARQSDRLEISKLATMLDDYVQLGHLPIKDTNPGLIRQIADTITFWGRKLGRDWHRRMILGGLVIIGLSALVTLGTLIWVAASPAASTHTLLADLATEATKSDASSVTGQYLRIILEVVVGGIAILAIYLIIKDDEHRGLTLTLVAVILSLTALQLVTFYLDQFTAIFPTLFQFGFLLIIVVYRRWYLSPVQTGEKYPDQQRENEYL